MQSEKDKTGTSAEFWRSIEQIEGLSVQTGLDRVSGEREDYKMLLDLVMKEIDKCSSNAKSFLFIKDLNNFRIEVHGIKGSLANIGAAELSAKALELENASSKEDIAFCVSNLPPFLEALQKFKSSIMEAFAKENQIPAQAEVQSELISDIEAKDKYFDLATLLILVEVDIRGVIKKNPEIQVGEYIKFLLEFENYAAKGTDILKRIAAREADGDDIKILANIMNLLKNIGCTNIISGIENTVLAGKNGHIAFAANCAKEVMEDYNQLQARIIAAKKEVEPEEKYSVKEGGGTPRENYETQTLEDAFIQLESAEAVRKLKILAVDDSPVLLSTIISVLSGNYQVLGITKPALVERFLMQATPDLFLLDYEMPEINGFELIPIIRNFEEHKDTPIIFLTSMGTIDHVSTSRKLGAIDFIVKPFQPDNLLEKVTKHIVKKRPIAGGQ